MAQFIDENVRDISERPIEGSNVRIANPPEGIRPTFRQEEGQVPVISELDPEQPLSKLEELDSTEQYINEYHDRISGEYQDKVDRRKFLLSRGAKMGVDMSIVNERLKREGLDKLKKPKELSELETLRIELLRDKEKEGRVEDITIKKEGRVAGQADTATNEVSHAMFGKNWQNLTPEEKSQVLSSQKVVSPADKKAEVTARANKALLQSTVDTAKVITTKIDEAFKLADEFEATGFTGARLANIEGTDAFILSKTLDTIKANLGFEELKAMKRSSPTGGALGQVTEREIEFLQNTVASLDIGLGEDVLKENLTQVKTKYEDILKRINVGLEEEQAASRTKIQDMIDSGLSKEEILIELRRGE